ncbi:MAG: hypothetical protein IPI22_15870 [Bacteroidetes bacterium]|nr:hypothetical protein [Bacteroidota bacterium]
MKKIFQTLLMLCMITSVAFAQKSNLGSQANSEQAKRKPLKVVLNYNNNWRHNLVKILN